MAGRGNPQVLKHVVVFLRDRAGMTQERLGRAVGKTQAQISAYEQGTTAPPDDTQRRMAKVAAVPWHMVLHLVRFLTTALDAVTRGAKAGAAAINLPVLDNVLLAVMPYLVEEEAAQLPLEEALKEAEEIWAALEPLPAAERRRRIETAPAGACRSWAALTRSLCEASVGLAADDTGEAEEVARLALLAAERVTGEESRKAKSHAWGYIANARRVANDFDGADEAFAQAWKLWPAEATADSHLFPEWRLFDLEASLRREQHRWPEALERLDRARARSAGDKLAAGRILVKKSNVFHQMGDAESALAVLEEAAPLVVALRDRHLLFALRFNKADNLARLERYEEAAPLMPEICTLAAEQANGLDGLRVVWLAAKVKAGTGRKDEAMADLEKVQDTFAAEDLPYDAALAGLDLSVLWLESGRTSEVKELAESMTSIFASKKITREALASLTLFCEAAKQESATVELARQVIAAIEDARRAGPPLRK